MLDVPGRFQSLNISLGDHRQLSMDYSAFLEVTLFIYSLIDGRIFEF